MALRGTEIWTLWKVEKKLFECFEMWCWRGLEYISWTDRMRNEVLHRYQDYPKYNKNKKG